LRYDAGRIPEAMIAAGRRLGHDRAVGGRAGAPRLAQRARRPAGSAPPVPGLPRPRPGCADRGHRRRANRSRRRRSPRPTPPPRARPEPPSTRPTSAGRWRGSTATTAWPPPSSTITPGRATTVSAAGPATTTAAPSPRSRTPRRGSTCGPSWPRGGGAAGDRVARGRADRWSCAPLTRPPPGGTRSRPRTGVDRQV
jgi:hypothetical protein